MLWLYNIAKYQWEELNDVAPNCDSEIKRKRKEIACDMQIDPDLTYDWLCQFYFCFDLLL